MASEFARTALGKLLSFSNGRSSPERSDHLPHPVYGSNGIIGYSNETNADANTIIIGRVGSYCGSLYFSDRPCWVTDNAIRANVKDGNDAKFMFYVLSTLSLNNWRAGSGQPLLNQDILRRIPTSVPLPDEQHAIAAILGALDDKIDLNRQMNGTLETIAQAIFKDWFVDFGPTRAKMNGGRPYLAAALWSLFPDMLDGDENPEGWHQGTLFDVSQLNPEVWTARAAPTVIEYVDLSNTKWGEIELTQSLAWTNAPSRAQRILRPGDTLVGTVRPGNGSYALVGVDGLTGSTGFAVLRPKRSEYREFVYLAATAKDTIDTLSHLADGAAYPAVRSEVVAAQPVILPTEECFVGFSQITGPLLDQMQANLEENQTLAQTRDLLLPKLISGEICVREAEKALAEVA